MGCDLCFLIIKAWWWHSKVSSDSMKWIKPHKLVKLFRWAYLLDILSELRIITNLIRAHYILSIFEPRNRDNNIHISSQTAPDCSPDFRRILRLSGLARRSARRPAKQRRGGWGVKFMIGGGPRKHSSLHITTTCPISKASAATKRKNKGFVGASVISSSYLVLAS